MTIAERRDRVPFVRVNLIGLGVGPTAVALITDFVFRDDNMVGYSVLLVTITAHLFAAAIYWDLI